MAQVRGLGPRVGGRLALLAELHSSREPGVRHPCSDFMDMLRRLINCCIIIIIVVIIIIIIRYAFFPLLTHFGVMSAS